MESPGTGQIKIHTSTILSTADRRDPDRFFFDFSLIRLTLAIALLLCSLVCFYFRSLKRLKAPYVFVFLSGLMMLLYGVLIVTLKKPVGNPDHYMNHWAKGSILRLQVVGELKHSDYYFKYEAEVIRAGHSATSGKMMVRIRKEGLIRPLSYGDEISTFKAPETFKKAMNPGAFDFKEYQRRKGIYEQLTLDANQFTRSRTKRKTLRLRALILRDSMLQSLRRQEFPKSEFSVMEALLLGKRQGLSAETIRDYQHAGAMHILAISGLHIGILLMILNTVLSPLTRVRSGKWIRLALLIVCLWSFAFISGLSSSVIRSAGMFTALSFGLVTHRTSATAHYLFVALFLSLIVKPLYVFDLGFQLSYTAVFSILVIGPGLKAVWTPRHKLLRYFWSLIVVSFAAQIGILPLSLFYFHQFSAIFFLSSICIVPFLGILLGAGYLMLVLDGLDILGSLYVQIYAEMIKMMNLAIEFLGSMDIFIFNQVFFNEGLLIVSIILIIFLILWINTRGKRGSMLLLGSAILLCVVLLIEKKAAQRESGLVIFQQYRHSLILSRFGDRVSVDYSSLGKNDPGRSRLLRGYEQQYYTSQIRDPDPSRNFFKAGTKKIMIIDDSSVRSDFGFAPDILVLVNSPKINLDRLLREIQPGIVVADGSNFPSYKALWRNSAELLGIAFHDTSVKGAFTHP